MKKIFFILSVTVCFCLPKISTSQTVDSALISAYSAFDSAKNYQQQMAASNQFKLIERQWPDNWLTNFYAAWSIAVTSFVEPVSNKRDPMLDEADAFYKKIEHMDTANDEVAVLGALLAAARLSVAPMSRHGKYGKIQDAYYELVKKVNPNNPRMFYLQGNAMYYTPKLFGGGYEKALVLYQKAATLFPNDSQDIHKPHWGKTVNQKMMDECTKKIGK